MSIDEMIQSDWVKGYSDGYRDFPRQTKDNENYSDGYQRGQTDALMDLQIRLKPKREGILND